jgi:adrenodoxin-NADP+ reductase
LEKKGVTNNQIDILDRLPTPYGLVRYGVAPDHPEVKNVQNDFATLFDSKGIDFFGNVQVGRDVSVQELRELYDVVVLAYGCESDRKLGLPGEDSLSGILSAREFVAWYNGK